MDLQTARSRRAAFIEHGPMPPPVFVRMPGQDIWWRPTPMRSEAYEGAPIAGIKYWDLSPLQESFDMTQPPIAPTAPPMCTVPPIIQSLGGVDVGDTLAGTVGTWTGSPTYAYQWLRDGNPIAGQITRVYIIAPEDLGLMIGYRATGTNIEGSTVVEAVPVGPVTEPPPPRRKR